MATGREVARGREVAWVREVARVRGPPSTSRETCCTSSRLGAAGEKG